MPRGEGSGRRNTFLAVPDAPVSKFVLELKGGKVGLIQNSQNLCAAKTKRKALAGFTGQSGKVSISEPVVGTSCPRKSREGRKHKGAGK